MARYVLIGYCNPLEGQDEEFNDWYNNRHFKDILSLPGVISGRRLEAADHQISDAPASHRYMGLFEVECDDPETFFDELRARSASGQMARSTSVADDFSLVLWRMIAE